MSVGHLVAPAMFRHTFCAVQVGPFGWTRAVLTAAAAFCVPVLIGDGSADLPLSTSVAWQQMTVRWAAPAGPALVAHLRGIPRPAVVEALAYLASARPRPSSLCGIHRAAWNVRSRCHLAWRVHRRGVTAGAVLTDVGHPEQRVQRHGCRCALSRAQAPRFHAQPHNVLEACLAATQPQFGGSRCVGRRRFPSIQSSFPPLELAHALLTSRPQFRVGRSRPICTAGMCCTPLARIRLHCLGHLRNLCRRTLIAVLKVHAVDLNPAVMCRQS